MYTLDPQAGAHFKTSSYKDLIDKANEAMQLNLPKHRYDLEPIAQTPVRPDLAMTAERKL